MPNRYHMLPGIVLMNDLVPGEAFIPMKPDFKQQAIYQGTKVTTKVISQKQHIAQALYQTVWGDFVTICKRIKYCQTPEERAKLFAELGTYIGSATFVDLENPESLGQFVASAYAATEIIAGYEEENLLFEMAQQAEKDLNNLPPGLRDLAKAVSQFKPPKTLQCTLRLRGPKPGQTSFNIPNKPVSEKAQDRFKNMFPGNNFGRGGHQTSLAENVDLNILLEPENETLAAILDLKGGATVGIQLDEMTEPSYLDKLVSLIFKNNRKILVCGIVGGILYLILKRRRGLRRFLTSLSKIFKTSWKLYKRISSNFIINNQITRRIWIFSSGISRLHI